MVWTSALAYHDELLAPRARLAELQRIGELVTGKGPTLQNEYEIYADGHFLRSGEPTEPAEYRIATLALRDGTLLTKSAWADLDSFPLATIEGYRSIVTRRSPAESRPPSDYRLVWRGRYYDLWQRPPVPSTTPRPHPPRRLEQLPYCGAAQNGPSKAQSARSTRRRSLLRPDPRPRHPRGALHADLLAYSRSAPIVARADQTLWPGLWYHDPAAHTLTANSPGTLIGQIRVPVHSVTRCGWAVASPAASRSRRRAGLGTGQGPALSIGGYVQVGDVNLAPGVHTIALTYPDADLTPGSGDNSFTKLSAISLDPTRLRPDGRAPPRRGALRSSARLGGDRAASEACGPSGLAPLVAPVVPVVPVLLVVVLVPLLTQRPCLSFFVRGHLRFGRGWGLGCGGFETLGSRTWIVAVAGCE